MKYKVMLGLLLTYFVWFGSSYGSTIRENEQLRVQQVMATMANQMTLKQLTEVNLRDI